MTGPTHTTGHTPTIVAHMALLRLGASWARSSSPPRLFYLSLAVTVIVPRFELLVACLLPFSFVLGPEAEVHLC